MEDRRRGGDYCGSHLVGRWLTTHSSLQSPSYPSLRRVLRERWEQVVGCTQEGKWPAEEIRRSCELEMEAVSVHEQMKHGRPIDGEKISEAVGGRTSRTHPENDSNPAQEQRYLQRNVILRRNFSEFGTFHSLGYTSGYTRSLKREFRIKNKINSFSRKS